MGHHREAEGDRQRGADGKPFRVQSRVSRPQRFHGGTVPLRQLIKGIPRRDPMEGIAGDVGIEGRPGQLPGDTVRGKALVPLELLQGFGRPSSKYPVRIPRLQARPSQGVLQELYRIPLYPIP